MIASPALAGEGAAAARFQTPEGQQWLREHIGVVVPAEIAGVKGEFDEWAGFIDGNLVDVAAGYEFSDPSAGEIFISDGTSSLGTHYATPIAAGPVTIAGEHNGILLLKTIVGSFERSGDEFGRGHGFVNFTHVTTFYFDLRARRFITE